MTNTRGWTHDFQTETMHLETNRKPDLEVHVFSSIKT